MPRAGRGEALEREEGIKKPTWTAEEYGALAIFEVELSALSADDYCALWHAVHPTHVDNGRDYNVVKLHETYTLRHYKDKSAKWCWISRPNNVPPKGAQRPDASIHTQEERDWFEDLREDIRAAAQNLNVPLPWHATARVDSGTMCACPSCQGTVKSRPKKMKVDDDGEVIKAKPRGPNAGRKGRGKAPSKKRKAQPKHAMVVDEESDDDEEMGDDEYEDFGEASPSRGTTRSSRRTTRQNYRTGLDEAAMGLDDEGLGDLNEVYQEQSNDRQNGTRSPQDAYSDVMAQFASLRNQFRDLPNQISNLQNEVGFLQDQIDDLQSQIDRASRQG